MGPEQRRPAARASARCRDRLERPRTALCAHGRERAGTERPPQPARQQRVPRRAEPRGEPGEPARTRPTRRPLDGCRRRCRTWRHTALNLRRRPRRRRDRPALPGRGLDEGWGGHARLGEQTSPRINAPRGHPGPAESGRGAGQERPRQETPQDSPHASSLAHRCHRVIRVCHHVDGHDDPIDPTSDPVAGAPPRERARRGPAAPGRPHQGSGFC